ncbi:MAG: YceI family protein [Pseudomonadota bacterium]|nr:YceI family protein [Pseudomonadota bacterium]
MLRIILAASTAALSLAAAGAIAAGAVHAFAADPQASRLEFIGVQAGAAFKGVFHKFTSTVDFAPEALPSSRIEVQIDLNSVDTMDKDRDTTIRGKDMFDVANQPVAHYVTKSIIKTPAGYSAVGSLTLHGVTKDVPIDFQFQDAGGPKLSGTAQLNRLDFGVGQGDWKSTEWVGNAVKVSFSLVLKPAP